MGHWVNIADGNFNEEYVGKVRTIGTVHARIGLEPQWYIGGYAIILDHLINCAVEEIFPKGGMFSKKTMKPAEFGKALASLVKAVLLDMDLAISVYIDEAEVAKQKAQAEAIDAERQLVCGSFGKAMAATAAKDISYRINDDLPAAYHALRDDFNDALALLSTTIDQINGAASQIKFVLPPMILPSGRSNRRPRLRRLQLHSRRSPQPSRIRAAAPRKRANWLPRPASVLRNPVRSSGRRLPQWARSTVPHGKSPTLSA
jgi:hypothetical protein